MISSCNILRLRFFTMWNLKRTISSWLKLLICMTLQFDNFGLELWVSYNHPRHITALSLCCTIRSLGSCKRNIVKIRFLLFIKLWLWLFLGESTLPIFCYPFVASHVWSWSFNVLVVFILITCEGRCITFRYDNLNSEFLFGKSLINHSLRLSRLWKKPKSYFLVELFHKMSSII